eukprot:jgi/Galph1/234/GphlegSOOS_G4933.1
MTRPKGLSTTIRRQLLQKNTSQKGGYQEGVHLSRRLFHIVNGILLFIFFNDGKNKFLFQRFVGSLLVFIFIFELLRLHSKQFSHIAMLLFRPIMRSSENHRFSGICYYLAGVLFASCFSSPIVFEIALLHLAIGDPVAAVCGLVLSSPKRSNWKLKSGKNVAGLLACWLVCFSSIHIYFYWRNISGSHLWLFAAITSSVSALVESWTMTPQQIISPVSAIPIGIDDNLVVDTVVYIDSNKLVTSVDTLGKEWTDGSIEAFYVEIRGRMDYSPHVT